MKNTRLLICFAFILTLSACASMKKDVKPSDFPAVQPETTEIPLWVPTPQGPEIEEPAAKPIINTPARRNTMSNWPGTAKKHKLTLESTPLPPVIDNYTAATQQQTEKNKEINKKIEKIAKIAVIIFVIAVVLILLIVSGV